MKDLFKVYNSFFNQTIVFKNLFDFREWVSFDKISRQSLSNLDKGSVEK